MTRRHPSSRPTRGPVCPGPAGSQPWSRRDVLRAGALGLGGWGLAELWAARAWAETAARGQSNSATLSDSAQQAAAAQLSGGLVPGAGRARACIFLFMWGGPSQLDTFDLKPQAPAEVRGEFQPIATSVPGLTICEHFEQLATRAHHLAVIRSLSHNDPAHLSSGHATLTGHRAPVLKSDAEPPSQRDTPHIGSVISRLRPPGGSLPSFVTMPWLAYHPAAPGGQAPGQHGGWLGKRYDPFLIGGDPNQADFRIGELSLPETISLERLTARRQLLSSIDAQRAQLDSIAAAAELNDFQQRAFDMLARPSARQAFDLSQEPDEVRERYGRNIHGQCVLLARRLVEHGVPLVSVNWHNDGRNFWDTHGDNFRRLKNDLIPPADRALSALLDDLEARGLLEETLVVWVGEFGRRPQITASNAGREHWPWCYSGLLAGGGIRGGAVYGASDSQAAYPAESPCTPLDYAATIYEALGIPSQIKLPDRLGRPLGVCEGQPLAALFG